MQGYGENASTKNEHQRSVSQRNILFRFVQFNQTYEEK